MIFKYIQILLLMLLMIWQFNVIGQSKNEMCMHQLREAFEKTWQFPLKPNNATNFYYLDYSIRTVMRNSNYPESKVNNIQVWIGRDIMYYDSEQIEVYVENNLSISVLKDQKTLFLADVDTNSNKYEKLLGYIKLQDTLLNMSRVIYCNTSANYDEPTRIEVELIPLAKQLFNIDEVIYEFDAGQKMLTRSIIYYVKTHDIAFVEIEINELDFEKKAPALHKPILENFYNLSGELLAAYGGYKIIDSRIKTP